VCRAHNSRASVPLTASPSDKTAAWKSELHASTEGRLACHLIERRMCPLRRADAICAVGVTHSKAVLRLCSPHCTRVVRVTRTCTLLWDLMRPKFQRCRYGPHHASSDSTSPTRPRPCKHTVREWAFLLRRCLLPGRDSFPMG